jgi:hypothetical protein
MRIGDISLHSLTGQGYVGTVHLGKDLQVRRPKSRLVLFGVKLVGFSAYSGKKLLFTIA